MDRVRELPENIYLRGRKLWMMVRVSGVRKCLATPFFLEDDPKGEKAAVHRAAVQDRLDAGEEFTARTGKPTTVRAYGEELVERRRRLGVASWDDDASRLKTHIYPAIGEMRLDQVRPRHINELIERVRAKECAPRTVRNIYSICKALFRTARIDGHLDSTPCILTKHELGKVRDAKTEWRAQAIFTRDELEQLISDEKVPWDRRVFYALLFVGILRHGEAAGLRWRHYVTGLQPLGRLVIATSYDDGVTKTEVERWMPVHQVLAAMLAEWKLSGWPAQQGRAPGPDDLVVPHPRPTNRGPRVEFGGMRSEHDSYKRMRIDCDALGLRHRRVHDTRRTGITLAREDGADKDILRLCTHGGGRDEDVMEAYTSFGWEKLCAQLQVLKVQRKPAGVSESEGA